MEFTYQITAASRPRVLMRLVQLFEQQSLVIHSLELALLDNLVKISVTVEADSALAHRIQAKLYHQVDIQNVDLIPQKMSPKPSRSMTQADAMNRL